MSDDVARQIAEAFASAEEDRYRDQYRRAMKVLREIPNGTPDDQLTAEQRQAWADHDEAIAYIQETREGE